MAVEDGLEGGVTGELSEQETHPVLVGPTTTTALNTIRAAIIPIACWRMDDIRFEFDSSFIRPEAIKELKKLAKLVTAHPKAPLSVFGHADPIGDDEYNKRLSGRRAIAMYALLIRDPERWEKLFKDSEDHWGLKSTQIALKTVGHDPGNTSGTMTEQTRQAVKDFQAANGLTDDGDPGPNTRAKLYPLYMDKICVDGSGAPFKLEKTDFLAQGVDPGGKGDFQGCSEFNPVLMFSQAESQAFKSPSKKAERDAENAPNRRVMVLLFRPGSKVNPDKWPCPRATENTAGCRKRFWSDAAVRRQFQANRRKFEETKDTFACRFYHRLTDLSPCESLVPPPPIVILKLTSPGIEDAKKVSHGAAVVLNDDHDNGQLFPASPPAGHRELEPIFDVDFIGNVASENDLLKINLTLSEAGLPDNVDLKVVEGAAGAARIRLWPKATKGQQADIITLPASFPAQDMPKELFVEGMQTGQLTLEATYTTGGKTLTDKLVINVVELQESQGGTRRIIYDYDTDIRFQVIGAPANYTFEWDLDGDGSFNTAVFEQGKTTADVTCRYGPAAAANSVQLNQVAANTRQVFRVAARMTGGLVVFVKGETIVGGVVTLGMRVALNSNQGTALPAQSNAGLHTLFVWSDTVPVTFSNATAAELAAHQAQEGTTQPFQGANRNQFGPLLAGANAVTPRPGVGAGRRVYGVIVGPGIFTSGQVQPDLVATMNHEIKHLEQHVAVRDNSPANNVWRLLDNFFGGANGYGDFREAEGHLSELQDPNVSWRHQLPAVQGDLNAFITRYNASLGVLGTIPAGAARTAARQLLQDMYRNIPFFEMKRPGYVGFVRAPV